MKGATKAREPSESRRPRQAQMSKENNSGRKACNRRSRDVSQSCPLSVCLRSNKVQRNMLHSPRYPSCSVKGQRRWQRAKTTREVLMYKQ
ncbi:hypothetical protein LZ32DRAFT_190282 [Colletotrichum eremochloae]|nr:hypothetical protein LZ32DRAFT_190282 [Colletotrichum eremochloae]